MIDLEKLSSKIQAYKNCIESKNQNTNKDGVLWVDCHLEFIESCQSELPSGSGFDSGTKIMIEKCTDTKIVLYTEFHHMDEYGGYDGWTNHEIIITPRFGSFDILVKGKDRDGIKEYIRDKIYDCIKF